MRICVFMYVSYYHHYFPVHKTYTKISDCTFPGRSDNKAYQEIDPIRKKLTRHVFIHERRIRITTVCVRESITYLSPHPVTPQYMGKCGAPNILRVLPFTLPKPRSAIEFPWGTYGGLVSLFDPQVWREFGKPSLELCPIATTDSAYSPSGSATCLIRYLSASVTSSLVLIIKTIHRTHEIICDHRVPISRVWLGGVFSPEIDVHEFKSPLLERFRSEGGYNFFLLWRWHTQDNVLHSNALVIYTPVVGDFDRCCRAPSSIDTSFDAVKSFLKWWYGGNFLPDSGLQLVHPRYIGKNRKVISTTAKYRKILGHI